MTSRIISLLRSRAAALACAIACVATGAPAVQAASGEITVYNAQHPSLTKEWVDAFSRETGIKVIMRNGSDYELANQILQEGEKSPADVFLTENSPAMSVVENAGLFAALDAATLAQVPPAYRPSTGKWTGIAARTTVFVYNRNKLAANQLPKSLLDLARPEWKGRWGASPSGADFQAIVSALLDLKGEAETAAWLKAMKVNAVPFRGNGVVMRAVNTGQVEGGIIYQYYYFGDQAKTGENSNNALLHYFKNHDPGAFVSISGGGVLNSSKNKDAAQAFIKWITSRPGQEILRTGDSYEYAVGSGVESNAKLVPMKALDAPTLDASKLNGRKVIELMNQAGLL